MTQPLHRAQQLLLCCLALLVCLVAFSHALVITPIQPTGRLNRWAFTIYASSVIAEEGAQFSQLALTHINTTSSPNLVLTDARIHSYSKKLRATIIPTTTVAAVDNAGVPTIQVPIDHENVLRTDDVVFFSLQVTLTSYADPTGLQPQFQLTTTIRDGVEQVVMDEKVSFLYTEKTADIFPGSTRQYAASLIYPFGEDNDEILAKMVSFATYNPQNLPTAYLDMVVAGPWNVQMSAAPSCTINNMEFRDVTRVTNADGVNVIRIDTTASTRGKGLQIYHGTPLLMSCTGVVYIPYARTAVNYFAYTPWAGDTILSLYTAQDQVQDVLTSPTPDQPVIRLDLNRIPTSTARFNIGRVPFRPYKVVRTYDFHYMPSSLDMRKSKDQFTFIAANLADPPKDAPGNRFRVYAPDVVISDSEERHRDHTSIYDSQVIHESTRYSYETQKLSMAAVFNEEGYWTESKGHQQLVIEHIGHYSAVETPKMLQDTYAGGVLTFSTEDCAVLVKTEQPHICSIPIISRDDEHFDSKAMALPNASVLAFDTEGRIDSKDHLVFEIQTLPRNDDDGNNFFPTAPLPPNHSIDYTITISSRTRGTHFDMMHYGLSNCLIWNGYNNEFNATAALVATNVTRSDREGWPVPAGNYYQVLTINVHNPANTTTTPNPFRSGRIQISCLDRLVAAWTLQRSRMREFSYDVRMVQVITDDVVGEVVSRAVWNAAGNARVGNKSTMSEGMAILYVILILCAAVGLMGIVAALVCCGFGACLFYCCCGAPKPITPPPPVPPHQELNHVQVVRNNDGYQSFHDQPDQRVNNPYV